MKWTGSALVALWYGFVVLLVAGVLLQVGYRYERIVTNQGVFHLDRLTGDVSLASSIDDPSVIEQFKARNAHLRERLDLIADENVRLRAERDAAVSDRNAADERTAAFEWHCL